MTTTTNWIPGLVVLGLGLLASGLFLFFSRRQATARAAPREGVEADLNAKFQALLEQRRALEAERHAMEAESFTAEATRLETAAADVLRERDNKAKSAGESAPPQREASKGWLARNPQLAGAVWGAGAVGFFAILAMLLMQEQKPRGEDGVMTGRTPPQASAPLPPQEAPQDPQFEALVERAKSSPEDAEAVGYVTHELLRMGRLEEASMLVERGLSLDPFAVELRVHRAVIASLKGEVTRAERELTKLVDTLPDAQEGLLFLAAMSLQSRDSAQALAYLERYYVEVPPSMVPRELLQTIHELKRELGRP